MKNLLLLASTLLVVSSCERQTPSESVTQTNPPRVSAMAPQSYANVVDRVAPAVITIHAELRQRAPQQFPFQNDPFFKWFFGNRVPEGGGGSQVEHALGSGVIVRSDGHILTNHHVVDGADDIRVDLNDNRTFKAKLVGSDPLSDLAVLKIDASNLPVLALGDSDQTRVGDVCLAVGNPLGVGETVTNGIISAKGRQTGLSNGAFEDFLQTDAPINQGNSGGALVNTTAELIGINSQIMSTTGGSIGIGFAIPSNMAKNVMDQLIKSGHVSRGQLGIGIQRVTSDLASSLGLKEPQGVLVNSVAPGGPADHAGVKSGDVIVAFNGQKVTDPNSFRNNVARSAPGTEVTLTISRDGHEQQVHAKLDELKPQQEAADQQAQPSAAPGRLGMTLQPLTPSVAVQLNLPQNTKGLVVTMVDPGGPAANSGIQAGDVIQEVNRQPVTTPDQVRSALQQSGSRPPLLLVSRGGQTFFVTIAPQG
ncbi:MAG: DegQ family serine endoprotease [Acidobacteriia bacterium]|nr:DegQ family serine endoprotease [Terriglobia bacterium]